MLLQGLGAVDDRPFSTSLVAACWLENRLAEGGGGDHEEGSQGLVLLAVAVAGVGLTVQPAQAVSC